LNTNYNVINSAPFAFDSVSDVTWAVIPQRAQRDEQFAVATSSQKVFNIGDHYEFTLGDLINSLDGAFKMTDAQLDAINSGITPSKRQRYDDYDTEMVHLAETEIITGQKTFTQPPISELLPEKDTDLANKAYVDSQKEKVIDLTDDDDFISIYGAFWQRAPYGPGKYTCSFEKWKSLLDIPV
jgi:hypothetical protein